MGEKRQMGANKVCPLRIGFVPAESLTVTRISHGQQGHISTLVYHFIPALRFFRVVPEPNHVVPELIEKMSG